MAGKISEYTLEQTSLDDTDRLDVSVDLAGTPTTKYLSWGSLKTQLTAANFLSDGDVDLGYTAASRTITNTAGDNTILPLFNSTDAGLAPLSGGGTTNFLRADGTWAAPVAAGDNLGDHTATEALKMATFDIENAGRLALENGGGIWFGTAVGTAGKEALFGDTNNTRLNSPSATGTTSFQFNAATSHVLKSTGLTLGSAVHDASYVLRVKGVLARAKFDYKIDMDNTLGIASHTDFNYALWAQSATVTRINVGTGGTIRFGENNGFSSVLVGGDWGFGTTTPTAGKRIDVSGDALIQGNIDATTYTVNGTAGANFSGAVTNITVVDGIVTAAS